MRSFCNPINITYKYQHYNKQASREAADPTLILFKGKYYLFASMSAGFYWSDDLVTWNWHGNRDLDLYRYAPDVRQIGEYLVFSASDRQSNSTFYRTLDPLSDRFEKVSEPFPFWDPNLFEDDDGRVWFYWGCDCGKPIYAQEFDPETLLPIGEKQEVIFGRHEEHGWERRLLPGTSIKKGLKERAIDFAMTLSGRAPVKPYIEGAFMNKWNGKYYLQYASPDTAIDTYSDGVYVGDTPLGPFVCQKHNPMSVKAKGFITGAGHGSTIEDKYGNLWHASTMHISVNAGYERRVGIFPAGIDEDGVLFCNQYFADYPYVLPEGKFDPRTLRPEWMLLSYKKTGKASSSLPGHGPELALNEDIKTCWCAEGSSHEWYELDLGAAYPVHAIQINFADVGVPMLEKDKSERSSWMTSSRYIDSGFDLRIRYLLEGSTDGTDWTILEDKRESDSDLAHDYLLLDGVSVRFLKITAYELPYSEKFALSGLRVFGKGLGSAPNQVEHVIAIRSGDLDAHLAWKNVPDADGYHVRYGIAPDKLYNSCIVYDAAMVELTTLTKGLHAYVCVDSFNENGITEGEVQEILP